MHPVLAAILLAAAPQSDAASAGMQREMGKALFKQGKLPEAIERFQAAVKLNPRDAAAWYNLAYASRKAQKFEQAAEAYDRYTQLSPGDPDGYFGLAESLRQSGKPREAAAAYKAYVAKEKRPTEQKWVEQSKERIAELESSAPQAAGAGQPAVASLKAADGGQPAIAFAQAPDAGQPAVASPQAPDAGQPASAAPAPAAPAPAAKPPPPPPPDPRERIAAGDRAFAGKDFRTALFAYQDAILAEPRNVEALVKAGNAYARMGHDDEALDQWGRALHLDPQNRAARDGAAAARERKAALAGVAPPPPLTTAAPDEAGARAHYTKGVALIRERKFEDALLELDQSLALKPGFAVAFVARGSARIGLGKYQDAIADYAAAQKADPGLASPLFGLAEAFRGLGQMEKAAEMYRRFAASNAPDAQPSLKEYALQNAQALAPK
jgi:tetratricopeptide (TPR) repeat protein